MPIATNNPILKGVSGTLGKNIVIKQWRNRVVIANRPKKRERSTEKQLDQQHRFKDATTYAKNVNANPQSKALYEKGINDNKFSAYAVALSDHLNPPQIKDINVLMYTGEPGELIRVRAFDDFKVKSVTITIMRDDVIIEKGNAEPRGKKGLWRMTTSVRNASAPGTVFTVVAEDYAGNTARKSVAIALAGMQAPVGKESEVAARQKENVVIELEEKRPTLSDNKVVDASIASAKDASAMEAQASDSVDNDGKTNNIGKTSNDGKLPNDQGDSGKQERRHQEIDDRPDVGSLTGDS
ncbi:MAG: hypothetical protein QM762_04300 [Chryseolinea sp.]